MHTTTHAHMCTNTHSYRHVSGDLLHKSSLSHLHLSLLPALICCPACGAPFKSLRRVHVDVCRHDCRGLMRMNDKGVSSPVRPPPLTSQAYKHACTVPTRMHRCLTQSFSSCTQLYNSLCFCVPPRNKTEGLGVVLLEYVKERLRRLRLKTFTASRCCCNSIVNILCCFFVELCWS